MFLHSFLFFLHLRCENFIVKDAEKTDGITHSNDKPQWLAVGMIYAMLRNAVHWGLVPEDIGDGVCFSPEWRLFIDPGALSKDFVQIERNRASKRPGIMQSR